MVHNTVVIQDGPCPEPHATGTADQPGPLLTPDAQDEWYRLADATAAGGQLYVHAWRVRAMLITQEPYLRPEILLSRGAGPAGPWERPEPLAVAPSPVPRRFTYDAVAHPQTISDGRPLLSYNVNTLSPALLRDASVYRPRFITVPWPPPEAGDPR